MPVGDSQSVLRCGLCNKPFDKREYDPIWPPTINNGPAISLGISWYNISESTLKRHGYYCRSRQVGSAPRLRACASCVKGKTRCDNKQPTCSRCSTKGIECRYSASSRQSTEARIQKIANVSTGRRNTIPSPPESDVFAESSLATNSDVDAIIDSVLVPSDLVSTNFGDASIDDINQDLGFSSFLGLEGHRNDIQTPLSGWYPVEGQQTTSYFNLSIPAQVTSNPRSLVKRVRFKIGGEGTAALILHTLKSYLRMMMYHHTLPPFIHPHTISPDFDKGNTEPLVNCVSLVHMIGSKVRGSRKLFWKNVRLECERLLSDVCSPFCSDKRSSGKAC